MIYASFDYGTVADTQVLKFAIIETADALRRLDEIAATPGLDGLSLALGGSQGFDKSEPRMLEESAGSPTSSGRTTSACSPAKFCSVVHSRGRCSQGLATSVLPTMASS